MTLSAIGSALQGIQNGFNELARNAQTVAEANGHGAGPPDVLGALVNLPRDQVQTAASVQVLKAASATVGTLLNVKA